MRNDRLIAQVKAMLERAQTSEATARLAGLLIILQNDRIIELEKELLKLKRKAAKNV